MNHHLRSAQVWHVFSRDLTVLHAYTTVGSWTSAPRWFRPWFNGGSFSNHEATLQYCDQLQLLSNSGMFSNIGDFADQLFPSVLWHCWLGYRRACTKVDVRILMVTIWLELCTSCSSSCHPTSIALSSSKIRNGDILVPANPGPPGKWSLCQRQKVLSISCCLNNSSCFAYVHGLSMICD